MNRSTITKTLLLAGMAATGSLGMASAQATTIEILCTASEPCGQSSGTTADGTIFEAAANPTEPSTGTGVFKPFVRVQAQGNSDTQSGYNTDYSPDNGINFDTKSGIWTHSVAYSRPRLPLIPDEACHPFHAKAATDSTAKLPPWQAA